MFLGHRHHLVVVLLGSLVDRFLVEFSLIWGSGINKKSMKKVIDDKMDVGMDFGWLLDRFLVDFGTILGGKLAPSCHKNPKKEGTKTMSKNNSHLGAS